MGPKGVSIHRVARSGGGTFDHLRARSGEWTVYLHTSHMKPISLARSTVLTIF